MTENRKKPRRGRPPRETETRTAPTMVFRPSPDTRELIIDAAGKADQSLSAEIDRRLRQSFWEKERHKAERDRAFGGQHNFTLGFLLARVAAGVEHNCGSSWKENALVWREVATAIVALLQLMHGFHGGSFENPISLDGRPNPQWDVHHHSASSQNSDTSIKDPHWFHVFRLVDLMLSSDVPLIWPLVDTIKTAHGDFRDDYMPTAEALKRLYANTGETQTPVSG